MSGNGVDLGAIYQAIVLLTEKVSAIQRDVASMKRDMDARFRDVDRRFDEMRQTINDYHQAVIGHGILLTEHEERIARLEGQSS